MTDALRYPPCPQCGESVTSLRCENAAEDRRFGRRDTEVSKTPDPFVVQPCGHEVAGFRGDESGVLEWRTDSVADASKYFVPGTITTFASTEDITSRPMTPEEQACDCGCMEIERRPAIDIDLTYYAEASAAPGVAAARGVHEAVKAAFQLEQLYAYGIKVGLAVEQAREVVTTWSDWYATQPLQLEPAVVRHALVRRATGEEWRP